MISKFNLKPPFTTKHIKSCHIWLLKYINLEKLRNPGKAEEDTSQPGDGEEVKSPFSDWNLELNVKLNFKDRARRVKVYHEPWF